MSSPILVTGGTGTLGRLVTPLLLEAGHRVRILSRHEHEPADGIQYVACDLTRPAGIEDGLQGADVIVHLAGGRKGDDAATRNLVHAAAAAGRPHLVYISVIGVETMPIGWFRSKLAAEQAVASSELPWTTVRVAQFHEFVLTMVQAMSRLPVIPVPRGLRLQPVDSRDVAARLVELALGDPAGLVPDLAGPEVYPMSTLLHSYLRTAGKHRARLPIRMPGKAGRAYRTGANLSLQGAMLGSRTWQQFLHERFLTATGDRD